MVRHHTTGQVYNINIAINPLKLADFKYFGMIVKNQNCFLYLRRT
jgi:hypothetical protein